MKECLEVTNLIASKENSMKSWPSSPFVTFIRKEESRGYLLSFKGEANTTWYKFLFGVFSFVFTRRITTIRSYELHAQNKITRNYLKRIANGEVEKYDLSLVRSDIGLMRNFFAEKDKSFWSTNSTEHVHRLRVIQRAECYQKALEGQSPQVIKNPENSIAGAVEGMTRGFFGGLVGWIVGFGILWLILGVILYIVEFFGWD